MGENLIDGEWLRIYFRGQWVEGTFAKPETVAVDAAALFLHTDGGLFPKIIRIQTASIDAIEREFVRPTNGS